MSLDWLGFTVSAWDTDAPYRPRASRGRTNTRRQASVDTSDKIGPETAEPANTDSRGPIGDRE